MEATVGDDEVALLGVLVGGMRCHPASPDPRRERTNYDQMRLLVSLRFAVGTTPGAPIATDTSSAVRVENPIPRATPPSTRWGTTLDTCCRDNDCTEGWRVFDCLDDGTVMHGEGCTSCGDCDLWDFTAASEGRVTCKLTADGSYSHSYSYSYRTATYFYDEDPTAASTRPAFSPVATRAARAARGILPDTRSAAVQ